MPWLVSPPLLPAIWQYPLMKFGIMYRLGQIGLVRDYLEMEFRPAPGVLPFEYDLERIIDDFVLFCMLIGNDFLPCAPPPPSPLSLLIFALLSATTTALPITTGSVDIHDKECSSTEAMDYTHSWQHIWEGSVQRVHISNQSNPIHVRQDHA